MRKHSPRRWLHFFIDMLPLAIIPIFALAVRSDNNYQPIELTVQGGVSNEVDITRKFVTNAISSHTDFVQGNTYQLSFKVYADGYANASSLGDGFIKASDFCGMFSSSLSGYAQFSSNIQAGNYNLVCSHIEYVDTRIFGTMTAISSSLTNRLYTSSDNLGSCYINVNLGTNSLSINSVSNVASYSFLNTGNLINVAFNTVLFADVNCLFTFDYIGSSISSNTKAFWDELIFNGFLTSLSDNFNPIVSVSGGGYDPSLVTVYNETDVGSQLVYTLYNATDKYFNMSNVFNLQGVYSWISTNLFGGNPPLMASVVWNIIVYEFVVDLLFIFYCFFMFLIDFTENLLEKPFDKVNRG